MSRALRRSPIGTPRKFAWTRHPDAMALYSQRSCEACPCAARHSSTDGQFSFFFSLRFTHRSEDLAIADENCPSLRSPYRVAIARTGGDAYA